MKTIASTFGQTPKEYKTKIARALIRRALLEAAMVGAEN
jgi:hypothetical protein